MRRRVLLGLLAGLGLLDPADAAPGDARHAGCEQAAAPACYQALDIAPATETSARRLNFYASGPLAPMEGERKGPRDALIVVHGHARDANRSFDAALAAARFAGVEQQVLVIAPLFQVAEWQAARCRAPGVPTPADADLTWTCASWLEGAAATNGPGTTSFAALDALIDAVARARPTLRSITVAGFSAGAQMVQHFIGFSTATAPAIPTAAASVPTGPAFRFVVADPGSWLYFDPLRPVLRRDGRETDAADCGGGDDDDDPLGACAIEFAPVEPACGASTRWKYGTASLPPTLGRSAVAARDAYRAAAVHYLEGALDRDAARGNAFRVLDRSCAAMTQGSFRLQRGLAYAAYDRAVLQPLVPHRLDIVPGCRHDAACVFTSPAGRAALFPSAP